MNKCKTLTNETISYANKYAKHSIQSYKIYTNLMMNNIFMGGITLFLTVHYWGTYRYSTNINKNDLSAHN